MWLEGLTSLFAGGASVGVSYWLFRRWALNQAEKEAQDIVQEAKSELDVVNIEIQERELELEQEIFGPHQDELNHLKEKIEEKEQILQEHKQELELIKQETERELQTQKSQMGRKEQQVRDKQQHIATKKQKTKKLKEQLKQSISQRWNLSLEQIAEKLRNEELEHWQSYWRKWLEGAETLTKSHNEWLAKKHLSRALIRFHRPYCAERGIPYVTFEEKDWPHIEARFASPSPVLEWVAEACGCEIELQKERGLFFIGGFDGVRRELARRTLEKLKKERRELQKELVEKTVAQCKQELLQSIKRDGDLLAKELGLKGLHVEIRKMMGALRYRYSFTQNQYFHCAEVGWLAGLLASELGEPVDVARRSGMLHDLGKAMDHEFEGGHAVIGADFIANWGESPEVVHAVRSHHYDSTPEAPLDFFVIAADALSGGRPGARRSTEAAYTQKVNDIENIVRSFKEVRDCFLLNGGRECRVILDPQRTQDSDSVRLAQRIAKQIEEQCTYPGQIRVVVVRQTLAFETKSQARKN